MLRFTKGDGYPFGLDYNGPIFCLDSEGSCVAVCESYDSPSEWNNWRIIIEVGDDSSILARMITATWSNCVLTESYIRKEKRIPFDRP